MSVKYQITLPEALAEELKQTAQRLKIPLAQFVRETMEARLRQEQEAKADPKNPFASFAGIVDEDADLASRLDEILYQ